MNPLRSKQGMHQVQLGFTLIELLVALAIVALIGGLSAISLHSAIGGYQQLKRQQQRYMQLQSAMIIIRRDISQIVDRPIIDAQGLIESAVLYGQQGVLSFTRAGYVNPLEMAARSHLQRVSYVVVNDKLLRLSWFALDQAPQSRPNQQILLDHVSSIRTAFIDDKGQPATYWGKIKTPNDNASEANSKHLPAALLLSISLSDLGNLPLHLAIAAKGVQ